MKSFEKRLLNRGCPTSVVEKHLSEVKFSDRKSSLKPKNRDAVQEYCPLFRNTIRHLSQTRDHRFYVQCKHQKR